MLVTKNKKKISLGKKLDNLDFKVNFKFSEINDKLNEAEKLAEKRYNKMMNQLDSIAGLVKKFDEEQTMQSGIIAIHSDEIKELQNVVFATI